MVEGRWDLTVHDIDGEFPSWVELSAQGGWFVGRWGSARPVKDISLTPTGAEWSLPKQYEGRETDLVFKGQLVDGHLVGTTLSDKGDEIRWTGVKAPDLPLPAGEPQFGDAIELVGSTLDGWHVRWPNMEANWTITEDGLENRATGTDLISDAKFTDFQLIAEYRYPKGSNSGIYLRGRYEYQVLDDHGGEPSVGSSAAIYGYLEPESLPIHPAGDWNTAEITLIGRTVTVRLNGVLVHDAQEIPGITGGALDSAEGEPGPILVQGDHGPVSYRRLTVRPVVGFA
jgi:hypothetical protein